MDCENKHLMVMDPSNDLLKSFSIWALDPNTRHVLDPNTRGYFAGLVMFGP